MRKPRSSFEDRERARRERRLERRCRRNPPAKECLLLNSVITRDFDEETTTQPPPDDVNTVLFNGLTPKTEIQSRTPRTKAETSTLTTTMMPNMTSIVPEPIAVTPAGGEQAVDGWILLVGILAGTTLLVTLVWNSMKLWCRKIEREAMQRPPAITYITGDHALASNPDGNRLAEVPVDQIHEFNIELNACQLTNTNEIALTNSQLNRLVIAGATNSTFNLSSTALVSPPAPPTPALTQTTEVAAPSGGDRSPPPPYESAREHPLANAENVTQEEEDDEEAPNRPVESYRRRASRIEETSESDEPSSI